MTITQAATLRIIRKLIKGEDYRSEVLTLINTQFLDYAIGFFKRVVDAKLYNQSLDLEWYRQEMLAESLSKDEIATHAGLNLKTIQNIYGNTRKQTVIDVSTTHYETLVTLLDELTSNQDEIDLTLTIKFKGVSVDLNISESLLVINALAVKRAALRGSVWSTVGKQVEKPLMKVLCQLHEVPPEYYDQSRLTEKHEREIDFYLFDGEGKPYRCEVKLMGRGNPESADATEARDTQIFIADTLSESVKNRLNSKGVLWVELKNPNNLSQFQSVLVKLGIPYTVPPNFETALETILQQMLSEGEADDSRA
ncbi:MAG: CfrBI family restriction endonuclease [Fimbriimonadales bacterium]